MHLVIGAGTQVGRQVAEMLQPLTQVRRLNDLARPADLEVVMPGVEVVHMCLETQDPLTRLRYSRDPSLTIVAVVEAARRHGVRRLVHLSSAHVYGVGRAQAYSESTPVRPLHAYDRLKREEEKWLVANSAQLDVVILRPAHTFGPGDPVVGALLTDLAAGGVLLPGGGRTGRTFLFASDLARAFVAAAERGRPGATYLVGGFDGTWRNLCESLAHALGIPPRIRGIPYELAYVIATARMLGKPPGARWWPNPFVVDLMARPFFLDDSRTRRELTWSPQVGAFAETMHDLAGWFPRPAAPAAT